MVALRGMVVSTVLAVESLLRRFSEPFSVVTTAVSWLPSSGSLVPFNCRYCDAQ